MKQSQPIAIDLFAGAGGFGLGFQMAGFDIPFSLEIDEWASNTLKYNHPVMNVLQGDIRDFKTEASIREACPFPVDVVVGGPPCQGFSVAGPSQKDPKDPRNSLFIDFARWVRVLDPSVFVMENVKGLLSRRNIEGESVLEIIRSTFIDLGYYVEVWVLNAAEYGIPQIRERVFIVGHHQSEEIGPPTTTHKFPVKVQEEQAWKQLNLLPIEEKLPALTLWDAISDLPELDAGAGDEEQSYTIPPATAFQRWARGESNTLYNHVAMEHSPRLVERFKHIGWGESSADAPTEHGPRRRNGGGALSGKAYDQNNRRLFPGRPSHTIAASFYANFIHPFQHRNITAREGARIQSFPDRYRFMGKKTVVSHSLLKREQRFEERHLGQYNQIGNAVPPLLARTIGQHIQERILATCLYMETT